MAAIPEGSQITVTVDSPDFGVEQIELAHGSVCTVRAAWQQRRNPNVRVYEYPFPTDVKASAWDAAAIRDRVDREWEEIQELTIDRAVAVRVDVTRK